MRTVTTVGTLVTCGLVWCKTSQERAGAGLSSAAYKWISWLRVHGHLRECQRKFGRLLPQHGRASLLHPDRSSGGPAACDARRLQILL